MNRYVVELFLVVFGSVVVMLEVVNPVLGQMFPLFQEPAVTYPGTTWTRVRWRGEFHLDSARLWVTLLFSLTTMFIYGWLRQDELEEYYNTGNKADDN